MINAAIVGLGWWGQRIVDAVQDKSECLRFIRGVSKEPDSVRDFAGHHGFELSTELDDVLADPRVEAVVLATPHSLHTKQIVAVAQAGKAVFSEKPLALNKTDAILSVQACKQAGVVLGLGTNKRFFPSTRELMRVVASGALGEILHIEVHNSNENSGTKFSAWRALPSEGSGGGMTGGGIHALDALVSLAGPVRRVHAQLIPRKPYPDPLDTVSVLLEFTNRTSGVLSTVRATPLYWRLHVFGKNGSAEALGENDLVVRQSGKKPQHRNFEPVDSLRVEFETFADAVAGRVPYPIPTEQMIDTIAAFEAIIKSIESGVTVSVKAPAAQGIPPNP